MKSWDALSAISMMSPCSWKRPRSAFMSTRGAPSVLRPCTYPATHPPRADISYGFSWSFQLRRDSCRCDACTHDVPYMPQQHSSDSNYAQHMAQQGGAVMGSIACRPDFGASGHVQVPQRDLSDPGMYFCTAMTPPAPTARAQGRDLKLC
jgi:hypothetical protein